MPNPRRISRASPAILAAAFGVAACQPRQGDDSSAAETNAAQSQPRLPVSEPPLDRGDILFAVARVASAAALGEVGVGKKPSLDGKRFAVRIRFGCATDGAAHGEGSPFNVSFEAQGRTLRVSAAPDLTPDDPGIAALAGEEVEAVEGFWMPRPWLLSDGCPVVPPAPRLEPELEPELQRQQASSEPGGGRDAPSTASGPRIGLAQFFTEAHSRTRRRAGRAYEATTVLAESEQPSPRGYNLVLSGRLRQRPRGPVIACRVISAEAPPECVVSVEFDRVWIEHAETKAALAEWTN